MVTATSYIDAMHNKSVLIYKLLVKSYVAMFWYFAVTKLGANKCAE